MNSNEFQAVGLYDHNANSYRKVKSAFESGKSIVAIVHATGTGKSYNALQLAYDNKNKKIIYTVPSKGIIEHIASIIKSNPNLDLKRDFPNLEFRTYQSFTSLNEDEIANIDCDLLILDEFHHIGAPVWGPKINIMVETHPDMKIFGMTAYTIRDRGTSYERDMTNPDTDELFSGKIESQYDLCDAMIDGIIPKPVYKSAYTNLIVTERELEKRIQKLDDTTKEYKEYMSILSDIKKRISEAPSIPNILRRSIKQNGKYIYFCPPYSEDGTNDIETIKKQALEWFKQFVPEEDIVFYTSTNSMGKEGKLNREAFYNDNTMDGKKANNKLRVMFAINQYNEGIHAPNIDGIIMGRGTTSDIIYFEQLGRALAVRGNIKEMFDELEKYTIEELIKMCKSKGIPIEDITTKEELIQKLIAPTVIDLTNNYDYIKELENNLRNKIKGIQNNKLGNHRDIKISDASFDIEIENQNIFEMLRYVSDRLTKTWDDYYELAKIYYEHHKNLDIPKNFKTINGYEYDENGMKLGIWIGTQRQDYKSLNEERKTKLSEIGFAVKTRNSEWLKMYELAKIYYEHHKNSDISKNFKTINGYEYDENGMNLGYWIGTQRQNYESLSEERKTKLSEICFAKNTLDYQWQQMYELAKIYYEHHKNLSIPQSFKTINGFEYDENGINLGYWISTQRQNYGSLSEERKTKLSEMGFVVKSHDSKWLETYELARIYYEYHKDLDIPKNFKTINGYEYDENGMKLGIWINSQRQNYESLSEERKTKLSEIGFVAKLRDFKWLKMYELAKIYYEHHKNLGISKNFKTINGYEYDENGVKLGSWINSQRSLLSPNSEKGQLLSSIGMIWKRKKNKEEVVDICTIYNIDFAKNKTVLKHISKQELQSKIEFLESHNIYHIDEFGFLIDIFSMSSIDMKEKYGVTLEEIIDRYYINNKKSKGE